MCYQERYGNNNYYQNANWRMQNNYPLFDLDNNSFDDYDDCDDSYNDNEYFENDNRKHNSNNHNNCCCCCPCCEKKEKQCNQKRKHKRICFLSISCFNVFKRHKINCF